ncbi:hypothetical protein Ahy_A09g042264 [Arachis hypogaea]|uniref:Uncharacterized protein n=1 Tax=Arachis hypogaea TaxID=3818 RepID=A0A445BFA8_ARAHY|nr:hypothetical protein Ahy_A09g042264 [Arachis hypogaea]
MRCLLSLVKRGARVLLPGCNIRYEVYPFYNSTKSLTPSVLQSGHSGRNRVEVVLGCVIPIVAAMVLFTFGICSAMGKQGRDVLGSVKDKIVPENSNMRQNNP